MAAVAPPSVRHGVHIEAYGVGIGGIASLSGIADREAFQKRAPGMDPPHRRLRCAATVFEPPRPVTTTVTISHESLCLQFETQMLSRTRDGDPRWT